jgi:WD40 repeat protein
MRFCHACQQELDAASLAAGRCANCDTVVRPFAQRTVEDKHALRAPKLDINRPGSATLGDSPSAESIEMNLAGRVDSGATIDISPADTTRVAPDLGFDTTPPQPIYKTLDPADSPPPGKQSDPERKSPTVSERSDMTMDFSAPPADSSQQPSQSGSRPERRSTHTFESDMTLDLGSLPPEEAKKLESQWRGTFDPGSKQGQTIRQKETVSGFRSSLPVKSRFIREKRKNGGGAVPKTAAEVPDYELLEVIGEGGMGVVYAAHQSSIARTVAIKMLKPSAKIREEQRDKFISEAVVTGELDHPNIVPIYDLGANDQGALFYSMKRVKGTPWDKALSQKRLDENLSILLRVADAVAFAHAHGVVHRDLKPENVMLGDYGEVLVMDWGLARITTTFANADAIFQADSLGGTPAYMAPEMARGPVDNINFLSDIYLLGAMLYEIIGGQPPHSGRDVMQCLMNAAQNQIDAIRYDGELKDVALRAMATKQADRYQSVKDFQEAIRVYQSHSESLVLTAHANLNLQKARESGDYQLFARALYGFQESLNLWDANHRARSLIAETQRDYAECALKKGDFDLSASLLDPTNKDQAPLMARINSARAERDARQRRLRRAKQAVAGLVAAVVVIVTIAFFSVRAQKNKAVIAQQEAEHQRGIAEDQTKVAIQQRGIAEQQRQEADQQRQNADQQKEIAVQQRSIAEQKRQEADEQRTRAEQAKQEEQYQAYVAQIGLANAKIHDNAFGYAKDLLEHCRPELRNWEWGRLKHLCDLDAIFYKADGPVDAVAYSPDGRHIASGDRSGQVTIRDTQTGQVTFHDKHGQYVHAIAYSPDGRSLATGSSDHSIRILDAASGKLLQELKDHTDGVLSVAFSPDGKQLLSGSYDNTARLWDIATGKALQTFKGHSWWVWSARFSPDGKRIVTASQDGKAIVWERTNGGASQPSASNPQPLFVELTQFTGHDGAVYAAAFSPNGKLVATGGYDKFVMIWNPDEVKPVDIKRRLDEQPDPKPNYLRLAGHDGPVRSVGFSPSGQFVITGGDDNAIRLWDAVTGDTANVLRGHGSSVRACEFSPDGQFVLSGGEDDVIRVWNLAGYEESRVLHSTVFSGHADAVLSARFSPDGKDIVTASRDRTAALWDVSSGKRLKQFEEGHEFLATSAVFFSDRRRLATGAGDNSVRIWDIALGTQLAVLEPTGPLGTLAVSPDGDWLVTGNPGNDAIVWDAHSGQPLATLAGHTGEVSAVAFSPQGDLLATGDEHGNIRLWHKQGPPGQWTATGELNGHSRSITAMKFTPDGKRLVSSSGDRTCAQWDVAAGSELKPLVLKHPEYVSSLDISPDGALAITSCDDGAARVWRLADAQLVRTLPSPGGAFNSVSFAPDGKSAILTSQADRQVRIVNLSAKNAVADAATAKSAPAPTNTAANDNSTDVLFDFKALGQVIWSAMYAPDGRHVLTIGGNDAELWSTESRRPTVRFSPHGAVASAAVSPDGKLLVTGSWDHSAKIWDAATGKAIRKLDNGHTGYINTVEFSPDGIEVLTASDDKTARVWNVASGKPTGVLLSGHQGRVLAATYSRDGSRVLTVSADKTARIWDRTTGQPRVELKGHEWAVLCGQFSPDGQRVVTGSEDHSAKIWDAQTGKELLQLGGHTAAVTSVAFSPDGSRVLTGSQDDTVKLWDAQKGKEILSLVGHTQEVTSVAFSPDGRLALSSSRDGTAIVWLAVDWRNEAAARTASSR